MSEFFTNLFQWFGENKDAIFTAGTITNIIGLVTAITVLLKQIKETFNTNKGTKEVMTTLNQISPMSNDIVNLKKSIESLQTEVNKLQHIVDENDTNFKKINAKIDTMLDVQFNVYSTIQDETLRKSVRNMILKAKTDETDTIVELKEKLAELQNKLNTATEELQKELNKTVESLPTVEEKHVEEENKIVRA